MECFPFRNQRGCGRARAEGKDERVEGEGEEKGFKVISLPGDEKLTGRMHAQRQMSLLDERLLLMG